MYRTKKEYLKLHKKGQVTHKGTPVRIIPDFSTETLKARRTWTDVLKTLINGKREPKLLCPAKLSITTDGENKIVLDKTKFKQCLSINTALQRIKEKLL